MNTHSIYAGLRAGLLLGVQPNAPSDTNRAGRRPPVVRTTRGLRPSLSRIILAAFGVQLLLACAPEPRDAFADAARAIRSGDEPQLTLSLSGDDSLRNLCFIRGPASLGEALSLEMTEVDGQLATRGSLDNIDLDSHENALVVVSDEHSRYEIFGQHQLSCRYCDNQCLSVPASVTLTSQIDSLTGQRTYLWPQS